MRYNPVKQRISDTFQHRPFLRKLLFGLLRMILLRVWYVRRAIRQWAKHRKGQPQHILDAGAGLGQHAFYLASRCKDWSVLAVDINVTDICKNNRLFDCEKYPNLYFKTADLLTFSQPDAFDLVLAIDVLEYIEQDEVVLRNFYTSLRPDGMLLVYVPSLMSLREGKNNKPFCEEQVRAGYSKEELCNKLRAAGFRHIKARYVYAKPGIWSWRLSVKLPMQWLNYTKKAAFFLPLYYLLVYPVCVVLNYLDMWGNHEEGEAILAMAFK
jgi:SAM-dependent methyltransferase